MTAQTDTTTTTSIIRQCADCQGHFPQDDMYHYGDGVYVCHECQLNRWMAEYV